MAETTQGLVTDPDRAAAEVAYWASYDTEGTAYEDWVSAALEAVAPGLRARWVADALEEARRRIMADCSHGDFRLGEFEPAKCAYCQPKVASVLAVAAEYRDGTR